MDHQTIWNFNEVRSDILEGKWTLLHSLAQNFAMIWRPATMMSWTVILFLLQKPCNGRAISISRFLVRPSIMMSSSFIGGRNDVFSPSHLTCHSRRTFTRVIKHMPMVVLPPWTLTNRYGISSILLIRTYVYHKCHSPMNTTNILQPSPFQTLYGMKSLHSHNSQ